jgi:hypothetical protein
LRRYRHVRKKAIPLKTLVWLLGKLGAGEYTVPQLTKQSETYGKESFCYLTGLVGIDRQRLNSELQQRGFIGDKTCEWCNTGEQRDTCIEIRVLRDRRMRDW